MSAMTITKNNFQEEVLQSSVPVLLDFWASWCGPCRMLSPIVDELAEELGGKVKVGKVNVDDEQALAEQFRIMTIPTLMLFKGGQQVAASVGVKSKADLLDMVNSAL